MRYLRPHEEDLQQSLGALNQQLIHLQESNAQINTAYEAKLESDKISAKVQSLLTNANQDISISRGDYNAFEEEYRASRAKLPVIESLIQQANNSCPS
ncbi:MAG: hypothetical protein HC860_27585 [Alkalinema sp. RU_4_3]|nr:hypothetical protein [Alkalinema sp. RU_4_3]